MAEVDELYSLHDQIGFRADLIRNFSRPPSEFPMHPQICITKAMISVIHKAIYRTQEL